MDVDGEFGFGVSTEVPFNRIYGKMQFLPWLEGAVKYTEGTHKPYNNVIDDQTWKDRIDLRFSYLMKQILFLLLQLDLMILEEQLIMPPSMLLQINALTILIQHLEWVLEDWVEAWTW